MKIEVYGEDDMSNAINLSAYWIKADYLKVSSKLPSHHAATSDCEHSWDILKVVKCFQDFSISLLESYRPLLILLEFSSSTFLIVALKSYGFVVAVSVCSLFSLCES